MSGDNQTPAGWYPDPWKSQRVRYWDGGKWTGHFRHASPSAPPWPSQPALASVQDPRPWWQTWIAVIV